MTVIAHELVKTIAAYIAAKNRSPWLECCAKIFEATNFKFSVEYSHSPVHTIGEKGWALDNLTWAISLNDAENCAAELLRALEASSEMERWFT